MRPDYIQLDPAKPISIGKDRLAARARSVRTPVSSKRVKPRCMDPRYRTCLGPGMPL